MHAPCNQSGPSGRLFYKMLFLLCQTLLSVRCIKFQAILDMVRADTACRPAPRVPEWNGVTGYVGGTYCHGHFMRTEDLFPYPVLCLDSSWPCGPRASLPKLACLSGTCLCFSVALQLLLHIKGRGSLLVHNYHRSKSHSVYNHLQYQQAESVKLSEYIHHRGDSHLPFHILHFRSGFRTPARNFNRGLICHPFSAI